MTFSFLNCIAVGLIFVCGLLFRREYRLVDSAIREKVISNFSISRTLYLWLQVKVFAHLYSGRKAPSDIFDEYYGRKTFIQANVAFWASGVAWGAFLLYYLANIRNTDTTDEVWLISSSVVLLLIGHQHASQLRHYIEDYLEKRSKEEARLKVAEDSPHQFGIPISFEGKVELPENDNEPVLSPDVLTHMRDALQSPEESLKLLQELGLVDSDGNTTVPYRPTRSNRQ